MSLTQPTVITKAFAVNGTRVAPPEAADTDVANQDTGYPLKQSTPYTSGGLPVKRDQTNGVLYLYSSHIAWMQGGGTYTFEPTVSTAYSGYNEGAMLAYQRSDGSFGMLYSTANNNTANFVSTPSVIGTNWIDVAQAQFPHIRDDKNAPYNVAIDSTGQMQFENVSIEDNTRVAGIYMDPITVSGNIYSQVNVESSISSTIYAGINFIPKTLGAGLFDSFVLYNRVGDQSVNFISEYNDDTEIESSFYTAWTNYFDAPGDNYCRWENYKSKVFGVPFTSWYITNSISKCGIEFHAGQLPQLYNTYPPLALGINDILSNKQFSVIDRGFTLPVNSSIIPQSHDNTYIFKRHIVVDISGLTELDVEWTENPLHELTAIPVIHCEYENNPINHHLTNLTTVGGRIVFNTTAPAGTNIHITIHGILPNLI